MEIEDCPDSSSNGDRAKRLQALLARVDQPPTEAEAAASDVIDRLHAVQAKITKWREKATPTAIDFKHQEDALAQLDAEERMLTTAVKNLRGDFAEADNVELLQAVIDSGERRDPANSRPNGEEDNEKSVRSHTTKTVRTRAIRPAIESALEECKDPSNTAEVWNVLRRHCLDERDPFTGVISANGHLQYMETNTPKWLRRSNLPRMLR